jgi:curved DNA-binding protein CbpA
VENGRRTPERSWSGVEATPPEIKARYKDLVKRLHPDANGGDRSNEDRLREIINAYNVLRTFRAV